jgi:CRISPR-associated protein Csb1
MDPLNLVGTIDDKTKAEGDWAFKGQGEKAKGGKLSEIGHGNIAPSLAAGGVSVQAIRRRASVSRAALLRVRFGDASAEAANTARAALLALAIAGDRLAFGGPSLWLRSGCDLVKLEERLGFELVGGEIQDISLDAEAAVEAFHELRDRATGLGIPMATDLTTLTPTPQLSEAINFAVASGPSED